MKKKHRRKASIGNSNQMPARLRFHTYEPTTAVINELTSSHNVETWQLYALIKRTLFDLIGEHGMPMLGEKLGNGINVRREDGLPDCLIELTYLAYTPANEDQGEVFAFLVEATAPQTHN